MQDEQGYLILTRRVNEIIVINNNIEVVVMAIVGRQVRLGVRAPTDVDIHRFEVWERIQQEKGNAR